MDIFYVRELAILAWKDNDVQSSTLSYIIIALLNIIKLKTQW